MSKRLFSLACWHMPVIPTLEILKKVNPCEFQASLTYKSKFKASLYYSETMFKKFFRFFSKGISPYQSTFIKGEATWLNLLLRALFMILSLCCGHKVSTPGFLEQYTTPSLLAGIQSSFRNHIAYCQILTITVTVPFNDHIIYSSQ